MNKYFAGYDKGKPVVFMDDGMGLICVFRRRAKAFRTAVQIAKNWQAHENKKTPVKKHRGINP